MEAFDIPDQQILTLVKLFPTAYIQVDGAHCLFEGPNGVYGFSKNQWPDYL